jgi:hypothetical protein
VSVARQVEESVREAQLRAPTYRSAMTGTLRAVSVVAHGQGLTPYLVDTLSIVTPAVAIGEALERSTAADQPVKIYQPSWLAVAVCTCHGDYLGGDHVSNCPAVAYDEGAPQ